MTTRMGQVGPIARSGRTVTVTKYLEFFPFGATSIRDKAHWELECAVRANVYPGEPGRVNAPIDKCSPPVPPEIEYLDVTVTHAYRHDLPVENGKTAEDPMPPAGLKFSPGQFEFIAKLSEGPDWEMANLDPDIYEAASEGQ